ncbi:MAG: DUF2344 domain-containing protein [Lachnospiraceae bacterium]|nr:DUF2344 domain-containing protein [Lachnospiraceae bacterium]
MKLRIRFQKTDSMKFIGHLDTMRFFQKLMRLAEIDVRYSEGFSPHPIMSFALPLGVGVESTGEYLDLEVHSTDASEASLQRINTCMPEGLLALSYKQLPDNAKNAMALVAAADYLIFPKQGEMQNLAEKIQTVFTDAPAFLIRKKTKKSERELDLKQYVYAFSSTEEGLFCRLSAGSETNIKPELLLDAFFERAGLTFTKTDWQIRRLDLYGKNEAGELQSLDAYGETIW